MAFSRSGLIHQLTYDGCTPQQAAFGATKAGLGWPDHRLAHGAAVRCRIPAAHQHDDAHGLHLTSFTVDVRPGHQLTANQLHEIARKIQPTAEASYGIEMAKALGDRHILGEGDLAIGGAPSTHVANATIYRWSPEIAEAVTVEIRRRGRRRWLTEDRLREVARTYRSNPSSPTKAVQERWFLSRTTACRWVRAAKDAGLI